MEQETGCIIFGDWEAEGTRQTRRYNRSRLLWAGGLLLLAIGFAIAAWLVGYVAAGKVSP